MPADKTQTGRRALQPACDACHVRRVKCSHDQPCAHCNRLGLTCTYTKAHTAKKTAGKRIEALRQAEKTRQQMYENRQQMHHGTPWGPPLPSMSVLSGSVGGGGSSGGGHGGASSGDGWNGGASSSSSSGVHHLHKSSSHMYGSPHHYSMSQMPPQSSPSGHMSDPRYAASTSSSDTRIGNGNSNSSGGTSMHHYYTNAPPSHSNSGSNSNTNTSSPNAALLQNASSVSPSSGWPPQSTTSPRRSMTSAFESDPRQVRFQPAASSSSSTSSASNRMPFAPPLPGSGSFSSSSGVAGGGSAFHHNPISSSSSIPLPSAANANGNTTLSSVDPSASSYPYRQGVHHAIPTTDVNSGGASAHVGHHGAQFADSVPFRHRNDVPYDMQYLPSPAQFFATTNLKSSFDQGSVGAGAAVGSNGSGTSSAANGASLSSNLSTAPSTGNLMTLDTSSGGTASVRIDQSGTNVLDYLQGSILPPLSTSMADSLFNSQGIFNADNLFSDSLPPLISAGHGQQTMLDMLGACIPSSETPGSVDSASISAMDSTHAFGGDGSAADERGGFGSGGHKARFAQADEPMTQDENHPLSDSVLIPTLALFYERLGGVMPVFSRNWIFTRLDRDDHQNDPHFASMLLAMSALTMIQAQPKDSSADGKDKKFERVSSRKRRAKALRLLEEALRLREGPLMGQRSSLETCCTSFFVFATLFGLGEHSAAWYRLRESITIAQLCKLHEPSAYEGLEKDEAERRLRAYWLLAITERAFAIQRGMPLALTGNPRASTASLRAKLGFNVLSDFPDLQLRLFDHIDEKFVDCWNRKCQGPGCANFDAERAIALWRSFTDGINQPSSRDRSVNGEAADDETGMDADGSASGHSSGGGGSAAYVRPTHNASSAIPATPSHRRQIQRADVEVTRHWLLNRLWLITLNHGLLSIDAKDPPLRVDHAIHVAQSVYDVCDSLSLSAMEAHGVGFPYKLFDIAQTLVLLCKDEIIAEAISKGGVGEQLEKQTTAAHTSGRAPQQQAPDDETKSVVEATAPGSGREAQDGESSLAVALAAKSDPYEGSVTFNGNGGGGGDSSYNDDSFSTGFMYSNVAQRGPASLRKTVLGILNEYLTLFQRFRDGDHPYLEELNKLIDQLENDMDAHRHPSSTATPNTADGSMAVPSKEAQAQANHRHQQHEGASVAAATIAGTVSLDETLRHQSAREMNNSFDTLPSHRGSIDRLTE